MNEKKRPAFISIHKSYAFFQFLQGHFSGLEEVQAKDIFYNIDIFVLEPPGF